MAEKKMNTQQQKNFFVLPHDLKDIGKKFFIGVFLFVSLAIFILILKEFSFCKIKKKKTHQFFRKTKGQQQKLWLQVPLYSFASCFLACFFLSSHTNTAKVFQKLKQRCVALVKCNTNAFLEIGWASFQCCFN